MKLQSMAKQRKPDTQSYRLPCPLKRQRAVADCCAAAARRTACGVEARVMQEDCEFAAPPRSPCSL